jgi:hypothetical protein
LGSYTRPESFLSVVIFSHQRKYLPHISYPYIAVYA